MTTKTSHHGSPRPGVFTSRWRVALLLVICVGTVVIHPWRRPAHAAVAPAAIPQVAVLRVDREDLYSQITIPAEFRAYNEVDVHAKVSGYVKRVLVDIGDKVAAGQLLAELEVPELGDDFDHAIAARQRAAANYKDTHLAYTRLQDVNKEHPNLVAQQDLDTAEARDATAAGEMAAARSDVAKYRTMVGYTRITAPFAGVITRRYADQGALIQAGTASQTQAMPLVRVSQNDLLRLDFPVSVDYVREIRNDAPVRVQVDSLGNRILQGRIARLADRVDDSTRTMMVEMEVPNPRLELVPGMYAHVTLKVDQRPHVLTLPVEAIPPGGNEVLLIDAEHRIRQRRVQLGLETADRYEVTAGLNEGDLVMLGNPAQLAIGQRVEPRPPR